MRNYVTVLICVISIQSCTSGKEKINPVKESITESVYASGVVKSINQYQVYAPVNGLIQQILVKEGDTVDVNEEIIRIRSEAARLNTENAQLASEHNAVRSNADKLSEAMANISFLRTKLKNDSLLLERQRNLWQQEIGTRNELDQRELAFKNSQAAYNAAMYRYNDLQRQLDFSAAQSKNNLQLSKSIAGDYTITSKMHGRVYDIFKKEGEMVTTQSPVAVIGGAEEFVIELQVDEYDISSVVPGMEVLIRMDGYKGQVFKAAITRIIPFMNERTRAFTVEASFIGKPPVLYPNMTMEANIIIRTKTDAITIPAEYLINDSLVMLASGEKRKVETGLRDYRKVEIVKGLSTENQLIKNE